MAQLIRKADIYILPNEQDVLEGNAAKLAYGHLMAANAIQSSMSTGQSATEGRPAQTMRRISSSPSLERVPLVTGIKPSRPPVSCLLMNANKHD
jgi:hypothetical protein